MATLTDYLVLHDGTFTLEGHLNAKVLTFDLPADFVQGTNLAKPILAYKISPDSDEMTLQAGFNDPQRLQSNSEFHITLDSRTHRGLWEAADGSKLQPDQQNTCYFMTINGGSKVHVSDVILWFQRNV